jgi:hypothetical protein
MERREVHVVACPFAYLLQQHAVHPVHDGALQLPRSVKAQPVLIEVGDENILNLQVAARIEQRNRVGKALQRSRAEGKAQVARRFLQDIFQFSHIQAGRESGVHQLFDGHQSLLQPNGVPDIHPEAHAPFIIAQIIGAAFEQPAHQRAHFRRGKIVLLCNARDLFHGDVCARLDEVQVPIAAQYLIVGQIVIHIR